MTECLHFHFSLSCIGEGNGNPLQRSCLENPRDGGASWAAVYVVAQSRTRLKQLSKQASKHMLAKYAQNSPNEASIVCEVRTSRCSSWIQKGQRNQRSNCQHLLDHRKSKIIPEVHLLCFIDYDKGFHCVDHKKLWKILKEMEISDHLTCLQRNLNAG